MNEVQKEDEGTVELEGRKEGTKKNCARFIETWLELNSSVYYRLPAVWHARTWLRLSFTDAVNAVLEAIRYNGSSCSVGQVSIATNPLLGGKLCRRTSE